ncbi:MAG: hypothetical protein ABUL60_31605 [Myxococcales bacterium]
MLYALTACDGFYPWQLRLLLHVDWETQQFAGQYLVRRLPTFAPHGHDERHTVGRNSALLL